VKQRLSQNELSTIAFSSYFELISRIIEEYEKSNKERRKEKED
jgi:hypothetical protein